MKEFLDITTNTNIEEDKVIISDSSGKETECDIIFTFECEDNGRSYIGFTDNTHDDNDALKIYACYSDILTDDGSLRNIESEEEITMVNEVIENILDEMSKEVA